QRRVPQPFQLAGGCRGGGRVGGVEVGERAAQRSEGGHAVTNPISVRCVPELTPSGRCRENYLAFRCPPRSHRESWSPTDHARRRERPCPSRTSRCCT